MPKITYTPADPADDITKAYGIVFEAGESRDVPDHAYAKLSGNPEFSTSEKRKASADSSKEDERVQKIVDGRSKEARIARAKAEEAEQDAAAKERAEQTAKAIAEAEAERKAEQDA